MSRFRIDDLKSVEIAPTSPNTLRTKLKEVIFSSVRATARVESVNPDTGEYKIVLFGTLDRDNSRFSDS